MITTTAGTATLTTTGITPSMTPENFIYWLQGFLEIANPKKLTEEQVKMIKDHIALVLNKVTPSYIISQPFKDPNQQIIPIDPTIWGPNITCDSPLVSVC